MEMNRMFQLRTPEEMYFSECFVIAADERKGKWMSATAIFDRIRKHARSALRNANI